MPGALEGQGIDAVELFARERHVRHSLHDIPVAVLLADGMPAQGVLLVVLGEERFAVLLLARHAVLVGGNLKTAAHGGAGHVAHAAHLGAFPGGRAAAHPVRRDEDGALAHAEHQQISLTVHEDAAAHGVVPVIIVREAAKRRLNAADGDRDVAVGLADEVAVDDHRAVRAPGGLSAGGIHVGRAALFCGGVVIDHAVDDAGGDEKAVIRASKTLEIRRAVPAGLREHSDAVAGGFQRPGDDRGAEGRMIHICVAAHIDEVRCVPAARTQVVGGRRRKEKAVCHNTLLFESMV